MMRLVFALTWLACVSVENAAQAAPATGIVLPVCGSAAGQLVPLGGKRSDRDCAGPCHAICRKHGAMQEGEDE